MIHLVAHFFLNINPYFWTFDREHFYPTENATWEDNSPKVSKIY